MKSKYNNVKADRIVNGEKVIFDSKAEARRYDVLYLRLRAKLITQLKLQPKFLLLDAVTSEGHRKMPKRHYVADFEYIDAKGERIVEDVKGFKTPMYNIKKQLFLAKFGNELTFKEIF